LELNYSKNPRLRNSKSTNLFVQHIAGLSVFVTFFLKEMITDGVQILCDMLVKIIFIAFDRVFINMQYNCKEVYEYRKTVGIAEMLR